MNDETDNSDYLCIINIHDKYRENYQACSKIVKSFQNM